MDMTSEIDAETRKASDESVYPLSTYQIKPPLQERYILLNNYLFSDLKIAVFRFKAEPIKEIIHYTLTQNLSGKAYDENNVKMWTVNIATEINEKVKGKIASRVLNFLLSFAVVPSFKSCSFVTMFFKFNQHKSLCYNEKALFNVIEQHKCE